MIRTKIDLIVIFGGIALWLLLHYVGEPLEAHILKKLRSKSKSKNKNVLRVKDVKE